MATTANVTFQSKHPNTPAAGTTIKTDLVEGAHIQYVKIDTGASGVSSPIGASTGLPIAQAVIADANNSSSTNIASGSTFTGSPTSTLGVAGLQVSLKADQNCTVYVDQSPDGLNWDIVDSYDYHKSIGNFGITVQAINSYVRVRVKNEGGATTTYFRLQTALCPIVEAVPRSLTANGNLKTEVLGFSDHYGFELEFTPTDDMRVVTPYRLVGTSFSGSILDTNFWTAGSGTGGSAISGSGQVNLVTGTTASNAVSLQTVRVGRYTAGAANRFRAVIRLPDTGASGNTRRWGAFDATDGAFFELATDASGVSTFGVVTRRIGVDTKVSSGSFNGDDGDSYTINTNVQTWEIYWTNSKVWFVVGGRLLHTVTASTNTWSTAMSLPARVENTNAPGGVADNNSILIRVMGIARLGAAQTQPTSKYQAGQVAALVLKYGAGNLHGIAISGVINNSVVTLYDSTTAGGTTIWASGTMGANAVPFFVDLKNLPFFNGLTLAITGANCNATVIYE